MKVKFSGSVYYANGEPISNVVVRIFDKDASGKGDEDLTITAGLSDAHGQFSLSYEPLRYLDYHTLHLLGSSDQPASPPGEQGGIQMPDLSDIYLPYLKFYFTINGVNQEHSVSLGILKTEFHLPACPTTDFLPSRDGFKFPNSFSGYFLPYSPPAFMSSRKIPSQYGLCGGMCASVYDFLLVGRAIPPDIEVPHQGTRLQRYLFQRQLDSLGGLGQQAVKVAQWTLLPDDTQVGIWRRTANEFSHLRQKLDQGNLVILALIYEHAASLKELSRLVFNNHQVLAWAYQQDDSGTQTLQVYDPNLPDRDDVIIHCEPVQLGEETTPEGPQAVIGLKSTQLTGGEFYKDLHGFFEMPYAPENPPKGL